MAFSLFLLLVLMVPSSNAQWPPSPGYWPSTKFRSFSFDKGYRNLWGPSHQRSDHSALTIWLDSASGSGFKSVRSFRSGYFGASIKLQPGYTAGVITAFYLSNSEAHPGFHDEVDIEFLGTTFGKPYTLQTNVYIRGSGDGRIIGREMKFHLWFDPTKDFHHYAILWTPSQIIFLVDDVPIRRYTRKSDTTFPLRPMWIYGSIWDASSWATEDGKYKADYRYQPFVASYTNFKASGCTANAPRWCRQASVSPYWSGGLTREQVRAMQWVQTHHLVYDYCRDRHRDHSPTPECYWK
ncbi:putative xyloglucan endotransglucosylase/hydrolase protein 32 [Morella rubra]|uniref:Xyloglucan endotransglucosylase/hydrolase n=1 Tax=Morella rubra TaxID=262757 RepID=A0A6A1UMJ8_9ROSI|nr:putative xyloglucan endotransglucosylase/hydrolase protein 32 [Morella rubra]